MIICLNIGLNSIFISQKMPFVSLIGTFKLSIRSIYKAQHFPMMQCGFCTSPESTAQGCALCETSKSKLKNNQAHLCTPHNCKTSKHAKHLPAKVRSMYTLNPDKSWPNLHLASTVKPAPKRFLRCC